MAHFEVLAIASEYRFYYVEADNIEDARVAFANAPHDFEYEAGDDVDNPVVEGIREI